MKVLLSIKPEFAERIFDGVKKYEYRRAIFKRADVKDVIVYASSPISKVIGEFRIRKILHDDVRSLWDATRDSAGITEEYFYKYFNDKAQGYAIEIDNYKRYEVPLSLESEFGVLPPQSFVYVE